MNFNLKLILCNSIFLGGWHLFMPYTLVMGIILIVSEVIFFSCRATKIVVTDFIFSLSYLLNLWYILSSWGNIRQYDYYNFVMHTDYFLKNNFFIDNPLEYIQSVYFQPPLWGGLTASITYLCMKFGVTQEFGFDTIRFLNLFFVSGVIILFWRLLNKFNFEKNTSIWIFGLFALLPINGILSNLVNNDACLYFFMMFVVYEGYVWYLNPHVKKACSIALLLFLIGGVKFSGLMVIPALGCLGILSLIRQKNIFDCKLWMQFALMGSGAVLGFFWGWFLLYYHFPLVPPPMENSVQNMAYFSLWERFFSVDLIGYPFALVKVGKIEANVWLALLKTSIFGEWIWNGLLWCYILYILGGILALFCIISFYSLIKYKMDDDGGFNLFAVSLIFSVILSWIYFWLEYPFFSSTEFRYITILQPIMLLVLAHWYEKKHLPKWFNLLMAGGILLTILARFMLYLNTI